MESVHGDSSVDFKLETVLSGCDDEVVWIVILIFTIDLHTSNMLYRDDSVLVINDPICNADMEDGDDLSYWADEMEIVD